MSAIDTPVNGLASLRREGTPGDEASTVPEQARRHHVVSKFYLRYYANDNERVTTVLLPGDRTFPHSIGDASVQTGYYTVIDQEGRRATGRSKPSRSWRRTRLRHGVK